MISVRLLQKERKKTNQSATFVFSSHSSSSIVVVLLQVHANNTQTKHFISFPVSSSSSSHNLAQIK